MKPLPSVPSIYQMIVRVEKQTLIARGRDEHAEVVALVAHSFDKT